MLHRAGATILLLLLSLRLSAQDYSSVVIGGDTISYKYTALDQTPHPAEFGLKLYDYMNLLPEEKKMANFSVMGGPGYSEHRGWQLTLHGDLQYRSPRRKALINELSVYTTVSLRRYYDVGIVGYNYLVSERHRLSYRASITSAPTYLYGLDYSRSSTDDRGVYTDKTYRAEIGYNWQISELFSIGVHADYRHSEAKNLDAKAWDIVAQRATKYSGGGVGLCGRFSTYKILDVNMQRGVSVNADITLRPKFLGAYAHSLWQFTADVRYYQPLWKWALLAFDLYGEYHSNHTPWMLRSAVGSDSRMRGYYSSRYNGNTLVGAQAELRQRVWEGLVVACWGGAAVAFSPDDSFRWQHLLPNYGVGIRWYLNPQSALRIDLGFGCHGHGFVVGLSEAF